MVVVGDVIMFNFFGDEFCMFDLLYFFDLGLLIVLYENWDFLVVDKLVGIKSYFN